MGEKHNGTYFLDLADNGYWLIKSEAGYRECIGVGDEGKKAALEKIERLNKGGGQMSKLKKEELLELLDEWFKYSHIGSSGKFTKCKDYDICQQAYQQIKEMIQVQPKVTEKLIKKQLDKYG